MQFRNSTFALIDGLEDALAEGEEVFVRGSRIRELRNRSFSIVRPLERMVIAPSRRSSVFAAVAETVWVLAGRDDVDFLRPYLPSADQFSDDGRTWRGAYGPRLRNWLGVDQVRECLELIAHEATTRRAAMSLFDPARDYVQSRDVPCNNWIHWLVRGGRIHMNVAIRSNDIVWGFSGINAFEWSVLHELMALWSGMEVGDVTFYASSFHLYERHYDKAHHVVQNFKGKTCYDYGLSSPTATVSFADFDVVLRQWFRAEASVRADPDTASAEIARISDPLFRHFLEVLRLRIGAAAGWDPGRIGDEIASLPESDLTAAAYEYFSRSMNFPPPATHPRTTRFWRDCFVQDGQSATTEELALRRAISALHAEKSAAYGISWKKRGEQISILANIARKVDRLVQSADGASLTRDESLLDTTVDLLVYALKYLTYLADVYPTAAQELFDGQVDEGPFSDGTEGFNVLLERLAPILKHGNPPNLRDTATSVSQAFDALESCVVGTSELGRRLELAAELVAKATDAVRSVHGLYPASVRRFALQSDRGGSA